MKINKKGIDLIKSFEGLRLSAYLDPIGIVTIGYGTTYIDNKLIKMGLTITQEEAERLLIVDIEKFSKGVLRVISTSLNDNQFSSLVSFAYNLGLGNLRGSTLLKIVNKNPNDVKIKDEFLKWNKAGGVVLNGLTRRRIIESNLYFTK